MKLFEITEFDDEPLSVEQQHKLASGKYISKEYIWTKLMKEYKKWSEVSAPQEQLDKLKQQFAKFKYLWAKTGLRSLDYARYILHARFPEGEPAILKDANYAYMYARDVIKGRWREAEDIIATNPHVSYLYAKDIINGRWPPAEKAILTSTNINTPLIRNAENYAHVIIKGRWPEAEDMIAKDAYSAYEYAKGVLKKRFIKGEPAINTMSSYAKEDYERTFNCKL